MKKQPKLIIPNLARFLEESRENFQILPPEKIEDCPTTKWLERNFPIASWGRVTWSSVPNCFCLTWETYTELFSFFQKIVNEQSLEGEVVIMWGNALKIPVQLDLNILIKYQEIAFDEDFDVWIINREFGWCIEVCHSGEIWFGYSQSGSSVAT
jgi:hypothetical protein